ncbi:hypothetical protein Y1Q_0019893 [Alligator mississippiensis]|uniref:Reverse transcriptase domain-containing protein n=1 Tax=Alligator mississippiensis TaxID=8496 RepID=A0A151NK82_ALLMI|nr:hypothetical protein Y1Q_0019893 [Alligator mississippiensis]
MFHGAWNINQLIAAEMASKTPKQVSEKRRLLGLYPEQTTSGGVAELASVVEEESVTPETEARNPINPPGKIRKVLARRARRWLRKGQGLSDKVREVLGAWVEGQPGICARVDSVSLDVLTSFLGVPPGPQRAPGKKRPKEGGEPTSWMNKCAVKRGTFLRYQHLFGANRKLLAAIILDGAERNQCTLPLEEVFQAYRGKWEVEPPFAGLGRFEVRRDADNFAFKALITPEEVVKHMMEMANKSAPAVDSEKLRLLGNWRPITIGSIVLRLFSRVLNARLAAACPINPRQRGFISTPGCAKNLKVLELILRKVKQERRLLGVVFVDIAKAFDSVSHDHISWVLKAKGVDQHIMSLIEDSYQKVTTRVQVFNGFTPPISIKSGVKQGNPMSPLLFNIAMDPLIAKLETIGRGVKVGSASLATLAFADDLVLLSDSWEGMQHNISILEDFCNLTGLREARILRHNKLCKILAAQGKKCEWTVYYEPHVRNAAGELRKPDLIFVRDGTALVVDVTVRTAGDVEAGTTSVTSKAKCSGLE